MIRCFYHKAETVNFFIRNLRNAVVAQHAMITASNACPGTRIHCSVNLAKLNSVTRKAFVCSARSVLCPRRVVADLSPLTPGLDPMPVHIRFTVDEVSHGQFYIQVLNILLCQCRSTRIPHSFICLPPTQLALSFNYTLKNRNLSDSGGCTV
jgi:hypothetical protein